MRRNRTLIIGVALLLAGATGLMGLYRLPMSMAGMMGGGMMMDRGGIKGIMEEMMGAKLPSGMEPRDLPEASSNGARLLGKYCTQCHEMPGPGMHTAEEWPRVVDRMNRRMQMMSGHNMMLMMHDIKAPSDNELQILMSYLKKHAQQAIDKTQYTDLNSPSGKIFMTTCSQCHALPDPKQHTVDEWPTVVERMTRNMNAMGKVVPDRKTLEVIVAYLQKHAK